MEHLRMNLTSKELEEEFRGANEVYNIFAETRVSRRPV